MACAFDMKNIGHGDNLAADHMFKTEGHLGILNENMHSKARVHVLFTKPHLLIYHNAIQLKKAHECFIAVSEQFLDSCSVVRKTHVKY